MNILQINSSIFGASGQSTQLADQLVAAIRDSSATVTVRDLTRNPIPYLDAAGFGAFVTNPSERTGHQQEIAALSDRLIDEVRRADLVVLAVPLYNLGIPAQLKSWFDHVGRAGVTFKYTEKGPVGLLKGKKAFVVTTRGGFYAGTPLDSETPHVRNFLGLIGITDVEFIYAEGLSVNVKTRKTAIQNAQAAIQRAASELLSPKKAA